MNTDVEVMLREGMERFTADLRAPDGLTGRIARCRRLRRRRLRRLTLSWVSGAAALTAGAVAVVTVVLPGAFVGGVAGSAASAAAMVKRVDTALTAAEPGEMAQMTVTTRSTAPGGTPGGTTGGTATTTTAEEWSYDGRWRSVVDSSPGHPAYDESLSASDVYTVVSYPARAWARQSLGHQLSVRPAGTRGCGPAVADLPLLFRYGLLGVGLPVSSLPSTVAAAVRTAVSCGTLVEAGRQRVDGIDAIKLTSRPGSLISETVWVSPGSYLPVRVTVRSAVLSATAPAVQQTADITWLPPTARNLARLDVPIPAGFRHVSLAGAAVPILRQVPVALLPRNWVACLGTLAHPACGKGTTAFRHGPVSAAFSALPAFLVSPFAVASLVPGVKTRLPGRPRA